MLQAWRRDSAGLCLLQAGVRCISYRLSQTHGSTCNEHQLSAPISPPTYAPKEAHVHAKQPAAVRPFCWVVLDLMDLVTDIEA